MGARTRGATNHGAVRLFSASTDRASVQCEIERALRGFADCWELSAYTDAERGGGLHANDRARSFRLVVMGERSRWQRPRRTWAAARFRRSSRRWMLEEVEREYVDKGEEDWSVEFEREVARKEAVRPKTPVARFTFPHATLSRSCMLRHGCLLHQ